MGKLHTHYDNLKVTRNAPSEVIRAAYKTLAQKYHPDKHEFKADAERVMALINESYHVLSDPAQRNAHDQWITQQEQQANPASQASGNSASSAQPRYQQTPPPRQPVSAGKPTGGLISHVLKNWVVYGVAAILIWVWASATSKKPPVGSNPYQALPTLDLSEFDSPKSKPEKVKPVTTAPNGQPWPEVAGYIKGYEMLHTKGLSSVTVDNSRNDSDVFVKLVNLNLISLDTAQAVPIPRSVRQFYIPAHGSFVLKNVESGKYDVRYRDLSSGGLSRSEAFSLTEVHTNKGTQFNNMTMTLYKVTHGNMQSFGLSEAEF